MKQVMLDFLNGLKIGAWYLMCFGGIGGGVFALCILHKAHHPWEAVLVFIAAIFIIVLSSSGVYMAGCVDRILTEEYSERSNTNDL